MKLLQRKKRDRDNATKTIKQSRVISIAKKTSTTEGRAGKAELKAKRKLIKEKAIIVAENNAARASSQIGERSKELESLKKIESGNRKRVVELKNEANDLNDQIVRQMNEKKEPLAVGGKAKKMKSDVTTTELETEIPDVDIEAGPVKISTKTAFKFEAQHAIGLVLIGVAGYFMYKKYAK